MARKKANIIRRKKPQMAVTKIRIRLDNENPDAPGTYIADQVKYLDLSQLASIVNRRFYSQGLIWPVQSFELKDVGSNSITSASVKISKLQDTWCTNNAFVKAKSVWNEQQMLAIEQMGAESAVARYRDFKIHMDTDHVGKSFSLNLLPISSDGTEYLPGEWEHSEVVIPDDGGGSGQTEYPLKMYGSSDADAKFILGGYAFSRAQPQSPDPFTVGVNTSWFNDVMDYGNVNDDVVTNAVDTNDDLPYNQTTYPGAPGNGAGPEYHDQMLITGTTISGTDHAPGGLFQCGLMRLDMVGFSASVLQETDLIINLVPGNQRGYATMKMEDF